MQVVNTATPGLVGYALADRADAVQIWEPAYTLLLQRSRISALSIKVWRRPGPLSLLPIR